MLVLEILLIAVAAIVVAALALIGRSHYLRSRGASFDCALRRDGSRPGRGWSLGLARYRGGDVQWYPLIGVGIRPRFTVPRRGLEIVERRGADPVEAAALPPRVQILECTYASTRVELAMSPGAMTGFLSWIEARPPGSHRH